MGLGWLLGAYFALTFMSVGVANPTYDNPYADLVCILYLAGALCALRAADKLREYVPHIKWLYAPVTAYIALGLFAAARFFACEIFWWNPPFFTLDAVDVAYNAVQLAAELSFSLIALLSTWELARSVGLPKHETRARVGIGLVILPAAVQILFLAAPSVATAGNGAPMTLLFLFQLVVYAFMTYHLYTCYSSICPAGEEFGKPTKPSRFAFINKINAKLDEKNEQARREYEKTQAGGKYSAKNNNRHHKKKK